MHFCNFAFSFLYKVADLLQIDCCLLGEAQVMKNYKVLKTYSVCYKIQDLTEITPELQSSGVKTLTGCMVELCYVIECMLLFQLMS